MRRGFAKSCGLHLPCCNGLGIFQGKKKSKPTEELLTTLCLYNTYGVGNRKLILIQVTFDTEQVTEIGLVWRD